MDIGVIAVRYARALLKRSVEVHREDDVYEDMRQLAASYIHVKELRTAIDNPMLSKETKLQLLLAAAGGQVQDVTQRFITLVLDEDRENALQLMANTYITLYRKEKNIINGKLVTATPVDEATEQKMRRMVENRTQGTVEFETEVDPELIGGFILEYDTYRMDASVQTRLRNILAQLKQ